MAEERPLPTWFPRRVALLYAVAGAAWIALSGLAVTLLADSPASLAAAEAIKGWVFIAVTATVLYLVLRRYAAALAGREADLREALRRVARLNRVYAVLSAINGAVLRTRERGPLVDEVCRVAVEIGRLRAAVVLLLEPGAGEAVVAARAVAAGTGRSVGAREARAYEPALTALREARTVIVADLANAPAIAAAAEQAGVHGARAGIGLPVKRGGRVLGALGLYAAEPGFFDDDEVRLLTEVAADTGLGLELIDKERRIEQLAFFDLVTGLPNRSLLQDRLAQTLSRQAYLRRVTAVVLIAITNFRRLNDLSGQYAGDELLRLVGTHLSNSLRPGDTVARIGSNDFGVVLADIAAEADVAAVVGKLTGSLPQALHVGGDEIRPAYRTGVALHPRDAADGDALLRCADMALEAAERGTAGSLVFYSRDLNTQAQRAQVIERELTGALARGELSLVYQPVVELCSGKLLGVEALSRWHSKALGEVGPVDFIPVAEETGLIGPIGDWVLAEACAQAGRWREAGLAPPRVAVNLSVAQLRDAQLPQRFARITAEHGGAQAGMELCLEITESRLMENQQEFVSRLHALRGRGFLIYIDDFGTGYSSLSYLHRLPAAMLKIDRSFVSGLTSSDEAREMVKGVVGLAHGLGLPVTAEGVETEAQLRALAALECDAAQGYYICPPVPAEEILRRYGAAARRSAGDR